MGQAIPRRHPAVVLRSQYQQLKALLAVTLVAILGLSLTVAILATDDESSSRTTAVQPINSIDSRGFNPATARPDESAVAAAIAPKPDVARPDESKVAASLGRFEQVQPPAVHDESSVAAAISGH